MIAGWGSGEAWQRAMTLEWMKRLSKIDLANIPVLFEGQARFTSLKEGLSLANILHAHLVLVDCDDATRTVRLMENRNQPELANPTMMNWASFLRQEASDGGHEVLDTSRMPIDASADRIETLLLGKGNNT
jgi:hypothetical protein